VCGALTVVPADFALQPAKLFLQLPHLLARQARPYLPASWPAFGYEPNALPKLCNRLRSKRFGSPG
jgi:hypothetical protein